MKENSELNLYEILKGHEGETFYSPIYGNLTYHPTLYPLVRFKTVTGAIYDINPNGKVYDNSDELFVYPSKYQRDWNKWIEEQNNKTPKTWNELCKTEQFQHNMGVDISYHYYQASKKWHCTSVTVKHTPIEKSALAFLKIHQLIEVGYGGNVNNEEWNNTTIKYIIDINKNNLYVSNSINVISHIAFHTKKQAEEFLSYPENVQLLKDYFMINN